MIRGLFAAVVAATYAAVVSGECANACNGHGKCTSYDMCICHRNWQANDCSERVCQFGLAHVDTPKGDLDHSGTVTDANHVIAENSHVYPYGTTEQFPQMFDSDLQEIENSAHYYMECSNKGTCDRKKGTCKCFDAYEGVACQRTKCPNKCSGHGVCKTIQQLANADYDNVYELWDRHATTGCECDAGFYGADCSSRKCKTGVDPLYLDDSATLKFSIFNFATLTWDKDDGQRRLTDVSDASNLFHDGRATETTGTGMWAIRFFDMHGEDWVTNPIKGGATCPEVVKALESLPNDVIPENSVICTVTKSLNGTFNGEDEADYVTANVGAAKNRPISYTSAFWETVAPANHFIADTASAAAAATTGYTSSFSTTKPTTYGLIYQVKFFGNPGKLREPEIETYLDGDKTTLNAVATATTNNEHTRAVITSVWTDGMQGENKDYFADHCDGVTVNIGLYDHTTQSVDLPARKITYLTGLSATEIPLLKTCLGSSDEFPNNNVDSYDWDYGVNTANTASDTNGVVGSITHPHIIKLVRSVTTVNDGGHYAVLVWRDGALWGGAGVLDASFSDGDGFFELLNPWAPSDGTATNDYEVYTTKGTLRRVSTKAGVYMGLGSNTFFLKNDVTTTRPDYNTAFYYEGQVSCEVDTNEKYRSQTHDSWDHANSEAAEITYCMNKGDIFVPLALAEPAVEGTSSADAGSDVYLNHNPPHLNLYTAQKLSSEDYLVTEAVEGLTGSSDTAMNSMWRHQIVADFSSNWAVSPVGGVQFHLFKFFPDASSTYEYVAECANRGLCNSKTGECDCFPGYTNDDCSGQNGLAV